MIYLIEEGGKKVGKNPDGTLHKHNKPYSGGSSSGGGNRQKWAPSYKKRIRLTRHASDGRTEVVIEEEHPTDANNGEILSKMLETSMKAFNTFDKMMGTPLPTIEKP